MTTARVVSHGQRPDRAESGTIERLLDRYSWTVFGIFACICVYSLLIRARAKPFWHDEIYTILHAGLPTLGAMWSAAIDGFDLSPPLNTWLTRAVHSVAGSGHITTRIPPLAGYLVMTAVVFHLLRTRANTATALAGALLPCFTAAYRYSYEARAYGLMVGLFALSLLAWSEAARGLPRRSDATHQVAKAGRRRTLHLFLLAVTLSAAVWNHYYGILTFVPIVGGEVVRSFHRRKLDVGVLIALVIAVLSAMPLYPLVAAARTQSQSFWSPAALSDVTAVYAYVFAPLKQYSFGVAAAIIAGLGLFARRPATAGHTPRRLPAYEVAAGLLSLLLPVAAVAVGLVAGVFVPRYAMAAVVGPSLVIPLAVWQRNTRGSLAELLLCAFLVVSFALSIGPSLLAPPALRDPFQTRPLLRSAVMTGPSLISASSLQFLQYWYYAPAAQKARLRYLADADEARKYLQSDTIDRGYLSLRRWTAVPIEPYADYVAGHREFRVHEAGSGWLLLKLEAAGATKRELGKAPGERLFLVQMPPLPAVSAIRE